MVNLNTKKFEKSEMAITKIKQDNLVETKLDTEKKDNLSNDEEILSHEPKPEKKRGFFKSTIDELKKVSWPTFQYVWRWGLIVILFTAVTSSFLGFFDHIFVNSIEYANCTSPEGRNQDVNTCTTEFLEGLTFRR